MSIPVAKMALIIVGLVASGVYATHMETISTSVGIALGMSLLLVSVPSVAANRVSTKASIAAALVIAALGLAIAWATAMHRNTEHASRILNDLGWAQATVGTWFAYSNVVAASVSKIARVPFDDATRARWRAHELSFGVELARRIVIRAQPSWAAFVVETAWPEPRPQAVTTLLEKASEATAEEAIALRESLRGKGGVGETSEARFELARIACDVIADARGQADPNDVGGPAVARFIVAAAGTVRDDDDAQRIFAALVLPAVARRA